MLDRIYGVILVILFYTTRNYYVWLVAIWIVWLPLIIVSVIVVTLFDIFVAIWDVLVDTFGHIEEFFMAIYKDGLSSIDRESFDQVRRDINRERDDRA